jgi:hypothetical protein
MDPFNPRSIAQANHTQTQNQRREHQIHWTEIVEPHLLDIQLESWSHVAEELLYRVSLALLVEFRD